jgi:hypothetical protein
MQFARRVFLAAGIYGILVLTPLYFLESRIGEQQPPPITHPEYYYGFIGVALAWQFVFLLIARHPIKYRTLMLLALPEKATFGLAVPILVAMGRTSFSVLTTSSVDLVWLVLFAIAYGKTPAAEGLGTENRELRTEN